VPYEEWRRRKIAPWVYWVAILALLGAVLGLFFTQ